MRRLCSLAVAVAMLAIFAVVPARAQVPPGCPPLFPGQVYTCTVHLPSGAQQMMQVTPNTCPDGSVVPGGLLTLTIKSGVFHITVNKAGDEWDTGTIEGGMVFVASTGINYTGHFMEWFGDSFNNQNTVNHFVASFNAIGSDGSHLTLHLDFHFSTSATPSGGPPNVVFFAKVIC
jgi:hypothetical protein